MVVLSYNRLWNHETSAILADSRELWMSHALASHLVEITGLRILVSMEAFGARLILYVLLYKCLEPRALVVDQLGEMCWLLDHLEVRRPTGYAVSVLRTRIVLESRVVVLLFTDRIIHQS